MLVCHYPTMGQQFLASLSFSVNEGEGRTKYSLGSVP